MSGGGDAGAGGAGGSGKGRGGRPRKVGVTCRSSKPRDTWCKGCTGNRGWCALGAPRAAEGGGAEGGVTTGGGQEEEGGTVHRAGQLALLSPGQAPPAAGSAPPLTPRVGRPARAHSALNVFSFEHAGPQALHNPARAKDRRANPDLARSSGGDGGERGSRGRKSRRLCEPPPERGGGFVRGGTAGGAGAEEQEEGLVVSSGATTSGSAFGGVGGGGAGGSGGRLLAIGSGAGGGGRDGGDNSGDGWTALTLGGQLSGEEVLSGRVAAWGSVGEVLSGRFPDVLDGGALEENTAEVFWTYSKKTPSLTLS
jgi:hypothetical protein